MRLLAAAVAICVLAGPAAGNAILRACLDAPRPGDPRLCACIQAAADRTLSKSDQELAAQFFDDPDLAQEIRQSNRRRHEVFWERYKSFGATAEAFCS